MNTKKWLQKKLEHSQFDGIIHYGNNGEKNIDLIALLNDFKEDQLADNEGKLHATSMEEILNEYHKEKLATNEDTKGGNIFELIREELDDWIFGVEDQAGVKLKVVDSADFNEIIINIRDKSKT